MKISRNRDSFENIARYVKISFFVSSVIPLTLLVYISHKYFFPEFELPLNIIIFLILAVLISVLGLFLLTETTKASLLKLKDLHARLESLIKLTKQMRTTSYPDVLLRDIVQSAKRLFIAETASLLLYDEKENLRLKVILGGKEQTLKDMIVTRGKGFSGWSADTGNPVCVNDAKKDARSDPELDNMSGMETRSILCAPLIHGDKTIGVIEVINKSRGTFTHEDEKLLISLADQAALSIWQSKVSDNQKSDNIHITEIFINAQDSHSPEKRGHVRRVAQYANLIGKQMGISETELRNLYHASLLHDIGFLNIDTCMQRDTKPWSKDRFIRHPQLGFDMIRSVSLWRDAAPIIQQHHERFDGNGYPIKKKGSDILLGARILFVAEVFDVITSKSSYRASLDFHEAIGEIEANAGTQFDPDVVKAFKSAIKDSDLADQ
jgi:HD-GYP domain-containing protein (c-di-GMP phosphodiesterase class II)